MSPFRTSASTSLRAFFACILFGSAQKDGHLTVSHAARDRPRDGHLDHRQDRIHSTSFRTAGMSYETRPPRAPVRPLLECGRGICHSALARDLASSCTSTAAFPQLRALYLAHQDEEFDSLAKPASPGTEQMLIKRLEQSVIPHLLQHQRDLFTKHLNTH